jgi:hypothetical protein
MIDTSWKPTCPFSVGVHTHLVNDWLMPVPVFNCNSQWSTRGTTCGSVLSRKAHRRHPFVLLCMLISHKHTHIVYVHIYCFSKSILFRFGLDASISSSCFSVFEARGKHQVQIHTIRRFFQSWLATYTWEGIVMSSYIMCVCDNIRTIRSILSHCATLQHKSLSIDTVDT